jgi:L-aminopeptidase/D-esterase-like protein
VSRSRIEANAPEAVAGRHNDITDVDGVLVGHHQRATGKWLTGTTVVLPPEGTVGGVDVRGGGPGTRETDLLDPRAMVQRVDAICLTGGSAYGLAAADGVVQWLAERNRGFVVGPEPHHVVPIVPAAVLFDLGAGGDFRNRPDASFGYRAAQAASARRVRQGAVGAGTGAHAAVLKGGIGSASIVLPSGITVAALVAANPAGSVVDPATGELWAVRYGLPGEFAHVRRPRKAELNASNSRVHGPPALNTTLAVVATDARLDKAECSRLAIGAHDGMARAVRPIHTFVDGDVAFALATGARELPEEYVSTGVIRARTPRPLHVSVLIAAAADVVARAIAHAVLAARSSGSMVAYLDEFPSARN